MGCRQSKLYYVDDSVKVLKKKDKKQHEEHVERTVHCHDNNISPSQSTESLTHQNNAGVRQES